MLHEIKSRPRYYLTRLIELILGCAIYALSINVFYSPAKLLGGGVTGIAQLLNFSFGWSVSALIVFINIPLFLLGLVFVNRMFTVSSLLGMFLMSGFLHVSSGLSLNFSNPLTSVVVGGALNGLGLGLIYRSEASAGGTDIILKIIQKYYSGNMAYTGLIINAVIVGVSALIHGLDQAVLTICAMYISSQINTYLIDGMDHRRAVTIITAHPDTVSEAIVQRMNRGATVLNAHGAYSHMENAMLYCVITRRELAKLKRILRDTDPDCFFTITRVTGVYGTGRSFHSVRTDIR